MTGYFVVFETVKENRFEHGVIRSEGLRSGGLSQGDELDTGRGS